MLLVNQLQLIQSAFSGRFTDLAQFVSNCSGSASSKDLRLRTRQKWQLHCVVSSLSCLTMHVYLLLIAVIVLPEHYKYYLRGTCNPKLWRVLLVRCEL